jgi:hypothetical protein
MLSLTAGVCAYSLTHYAIYVAVELLLSVEIFYETHLYLLGKGSAAF